MLEVVVMRGGEVLGQRNSKRSRGRQTVVEEEVVSNVEEDGHSSGRIQDTDQGEEEKVPGPTIGPPCKRRRRHQVVLIEVAEEAPLY